MLVLPCEKFNRWSCHTVWLQRFFMTACALMEMPISALALTLHLKARELDALTLHLKARELDALTRDLSEQLVARATVDSELLPVYLDLIFVARSLQRIGDHAANIAEDSFW